MKFWKDFIWTIRDFALTVKTMLLAIQEEISKNNHQLKNIESKLYTGFSYVANAEPIQKVTTNPGVLLEANPCRSFLIIQNVGAYPCYIRLANEVTLESFHFILAADTSEKEGNGGNIELKDYTGEIHAVSTGTTSVSILEY